MNPSAVIATVDLVKSTPWLLAGIRETYDFKKRHNPGMMPFDQWLADVYALRVCEESERFCGGFSIDTVRRIAEIEYKGVGIAKDLKQVFGIEEIYSYVEEGFVHLVAVCKRNEDGSSDLADKVRDYLRDNGYADAECIYDYNDEEIPVSASRRFIPPRTLAAGKEVNQ